MYIYICMYVIAYNMSALFFALRWGLLILQFHSPGRDARDMWSTQRTRCWDNGWLNGTSHENG